MSNYHILSADGMPNAFAVVYHVPVPNANNDVGINFRTAMTQYRAAFISSVPFIAVAEQTQLDNGELLEYTEAFHSNPGESLVQKRNQLDARYAAVVTEQQTKWQNILSFWGFSRDVP